MRKGWIGLGSDQHCRGRNIKHETSPPLEDAWTGVRKPDLSWEVVVAGSRSETGSGGKFMRCAFSLYIYLFIDTFCRLFLSLLPDLWSARRGISFLCYLARALVLIVKNVYCLKRRLGTGVVLCTSE